MKVKTSEAVKSGIETPPILAESGDQAVNTPAAPQAGNVIAGSERIKSNPDITDEPKSEEHLHMALLGNSPSLREIYLKVPEDGERYHCCQSGQD